MNSQELYDNSKIAEWQGSTLCAKLLKKAAESMAKMEAELAALLVPKVERPSVEGWYWWLPADTRFCPLILEMDEEDLRRAGGPDKGNWYGPIPKPESEAADD